VKNKPLLYLLFATISLSALPELLIAQNGLDVRIDSLQRTAREAAHDTTKIRLYLALLPEIMIRYRLFGSTTEDSVLYFRTLEACRQQSRKLNNNYGLGCALLWEASFNNERARLSSRDELVKQAFSIFRTTNNKAGLAIAYYFKADYTSVTDNPSLKLHLYDTAIQYAKASGDRLREEKCTSGIGNTYLWMAKYEEAIKILLRLSDMQKQSGSRMIVSTTDLLTAAYYFKGDMKHALRFAISAVEYGRRLNDTAYIGTFYKRLATIYRNIYDYEKSYQYFELSLSAYRRGNSPIMNSMKVMSIAGMADCLIRQGRPKEALALMKDSLSKFKGGQTPVTLLNAMYLELYYAMGDYHNARKYLEKLLASDNKWGASFDGIQILTMAGKTYFALAKFDKAALYSDSACRLSGQLKSWPHIMENYHTLFRLDSVKGDYRSAMKHYQEYKQASDSFQRDVANKQMIEMSVQYETDQKNSELASLSNKAKLQQETIRQGKILRNLMIAASCLLLLLLLLAYNRYRVKQKANKLLQQKQDEINRQNIVLAKMVEAEKKTTVEKEWLIKEINHRVKNNLQCIMSLLDSQRAYLKDEVALNAINDSQHRVEAIALIHKKLYQNDKLNTMIEMTSYVRELTEYLADSFGLEGRIQIDLFIESITLDVTQSVPLGVIINEAFTNAVKYAFTGMSDGKITIRMERTPAANIELLVSDNGVGFPEHFDWRKSQSLGMNLIRGLAKQIDAHFELLNGNGVTLKITFEKTQSMRV
jgi:two-component sensor histidine kinase